MVQNAEDRIQKIEPKSGRVLATIRAPGGGGDSGLAWAEGTLWVGQHRGRKIHQIDPDTGAILRTIESDRVVTGVTWIDGELWHGTWEVRRAMCGASIHERERSWKSLRCPPEWACRGLSRTAAISSSAGGGSSGKVRAVRRPRRRAAAKTKK